MNSLLLRKDQGEKEKKKKILISLILDFFKIQEPEKIINSINKRFLNLDKIFHCVSIQMTGIFLKTPSSHLKNI